MGQGRVCTLVLSSLATVASCIDPSVRIATKSPKVEPLLIFSISLMYSLGLWEKKSLTGYPCTCGWALSGCRRAWSVCCRSPAAPTPRQTRPSSTRPACLVACKVWKLGKQMFQKPKKYRTTKMYNLYLRRMLPVPSLKLIRRFLLVIVTNLYQRMY